MARRPIDIHEKLKASLLESRAGADLSRPARREPHGVSDAHLVLDSRLARSGTDPAAGRYEFNMAPEGASAHGAIGVPHAMTTVIELHVAQFTIPLPNLLPYDVSLVQPGQALPLLDFIPNGPNLAPGALPIGPIGPIIPVPGPQRRDSLHGPLTQIPNGRVALYFPELGSQAHRGAGGRQFHFEFTAEYISPLPAAGTDLPPNYGVRLTPAAPHCGKFVFTRPIGSVHGLTAQFYSPDNPLSLPSETVENLQVWTSEAAGGRAGAPTIRIVAIDGRDLNELASPGDRVYFDNVALTMPPVPNQPAPLPGAPPVPNQPAPLPGAPPDAGIPAMEAYARHLGRPEGHLVGTPVDPNNLAINPFFTLALQLNPNPRLRDMRAETVLQAGGLTMRIAKNRVRIPLRLRGVVPGLTNYIEP